MTTLLEAAQQALEALERYQVKRQDFDRFADEITALRTALAEPVQEPVAAERDRLLSLAKRRADREASEAAHHAGRWHAAHEHHLTRHAAMLELIGALAETATENSSEVEPAAEGGTPSWGIDWGRDGDKVCVSITKMLPNGSIEIVDTQYEPPGWRQQKTD